jgi:hypothetical protein
MGAFPSNKKKLYIVLKPKKLFGGEFTRIVVACGQNAGETVILNHQDSTLEGVGQEFCLNVRVRLQRSPS